MLVEHIFFTLAVVIVVGIYFARYTGRAYLWWLIILASILPDADHINNVMWDLGILQFPVHIVPFIKIGLFHNLLWLVIFSAIIAVIFEHQKKAWILDAFLFVAFGYALHLIEDWLVYPPVYSFLYPLSEKAYGINLLPETMDLGIAGTDVLNAGLVLLCIAISICIYDYETVENAESRENEETE